jgi:flagellar protein FlaG
MQSKVAPFAATPDPTYGRQPAVASESGANPGMAAVSEEADLRLQIEEDKAGGVYVYKIINRRTGEVVQQMPREEVLRLRDNTAYLAGGVIRTKA